MLFSLVTWVFLLGGLYLAFGWGFFASDASFIEVKANILGRESSSHHHASSSAEAKKGSLRKQENLSPFWPHLHRKMETEKLSE